MELKSTGTKPPAVSQVEHSHGTSEMESYFFVFCNTNNDQTQCGEDFLPHTQHSALVDIYSK